MAAVTTMKRLTISLTLIIWILVYLIIIEHCNGVEDAL